MKIRVKLDDRVSLVEETASEAFGKCGKLVLRGKVLSSDDTIASTGIEEDDIVVACDGAVSFTEKRDLLI